MLVGLILVDSAYYKKSIVELTKSNKATERAQQAKNNLLQSEVDWLKAIDESKNVRTNNVWNFEVNKTLMQFARDIKYQQDSFGIKVSRLVVSGEASNSIVDVSNRLIVLDSVSYIPVDIGGTYLYLPDLTAYVKTLIKEGILVRKLNIGNALTFQMTIYIPTKTQQ